MVPISTILVLRATTDRPFEEPEEALEPVRQAQMAALVRQVADTGGQVFVVTHSTEIARSFAVDDLHLVATRPRGASRSLRDVLSKRAKQGYEQPAGRAGGATRPAPARTKGRSLSEISRQLDASPGRQRPIDGWGH
jgi:hypothetical protein